jgi:hypothetical protein
VEIDLATKQQLANLLAKPSTVTQADAGLLSQLAAKYPYYQPLHLLLAKAKGDSNANGELAKAALYTNGNVLHQVIYHAEKLRVRQVKLAGFVAIKADENPIAEKDYKTGAVEEKESQPVDEQEVFEEITEVTARENWNEEEEIFEEIAEIDLPQRQEMESANSYKAVEEDTFEEIAELDPSAYVVNSTITEANSISDKEEDILPDELAIESIVATDFFAFEERFHTEPASGDQKTSPVIVSQPEEYNQEAEDQTVSKYNDDKLPYTFLWWLAKTRKEHEQIFQPYVTPKKQENPVQGELQQQYVEHIFHLQTPFNVADEAGKGPINKGIAHKGDEIIENFIKNEPQIRTPKAEQINNENKAKKSAEDHNDLVSETLAAIYIEQMLYHKAIDTYEKLSLKFPEKSRYFADLIQSLEKKI